MKEQAIKITKEIGGELLFTIIQWGKDCLKNLIREGLSKYASHNKSTFRGEVIDVPFLNQQTLIENVRNKAPKNANGAAAYQKSTDQAYYIYITYMEDKELISKEKNYEFVIKSECKARDIEILFDGKEIIILN